MATKWEFTIKDDSNTVKFEIFEDQTFDIMSGEIDSIFNTAADVQTLLGVCPKIINVMKVNSVNELKVKETTV
jgi:hypothetical protein